MSLLRRVFGDADEFRAGLKEPPDWLWGALGGERTHSGVVVNEGTALGQDPVWACITLLARSIAQMPLIVYQGTGRDRERAKGTWQWSLLHENPNPMTQPDVFIEDTIGLLNSWGNFYAEKVKVEYRNRTIVGEMWRIDPSSVVVESNRAGNKFFNIDGDSRTYTSADILHIPGFGYNGRKGLSPIAMHRQGLGAEAAREEANGRSYANASVPPGVIEVDGKLSPEGAAKLKSSWEAAHRGLHNYGRIGVLEEGASYRAIGLPQRDQQYIEQARFGVNKAGRIFQVPPEKIGGERAHSNTYSNVQSANLDFVIFSLQHWMTRVEQGFKHDPDLFPPGLDLYPEFLAEGLLRGDPEGRARYYTAMSAMQAMTVNEIRERENLAPVPWGDEPVPMPGSPAPAADAAPPATDPALAAKVDNVVSMVRALGVKPELAPLNVWVDMPEVHVDVQPAELPAIQFEPNIDVRVDGEGFAPAQIEQRSSRRTLRVERDDAGNALRYIEEQIDG